MKKIFALALALAACTDEAPTDVGDALLPSGDVLTFEVLLPAERFLVSDTSFSGYNLPIDASFGLIANKRDGVVDANTLFRFSLPPRTITVRPTTGTTTVVDSQPRFVSGQVVVKLDTLTASARPIFFRMFRTAEEWHTSATWTSRVDTTNTRLRWATPGGTRGALIDTATWTAGDSVVFDVDSATLAFWADSTNRARGAILVAETNGAFARTFTTTVNVNAKSSIRADTTVNVTLVPSVRTFVFNPTLVSPWSEARVGGIPTWRTFMRFRDDLRSIVLPCAGGGVNCRVSLDSVRINRAELLLRTAASPLGFAPEDSIIVEARTLVTAAQVPVERTPIMGAISRSNVIAGGAFRTGGETVVRLDVTGFIVHQLDESVAATSRVPPYLALLQIPETSTFGFASFTPTPVLRLVVTTTVEDQ